MVDDKQQGLTGIREEARGLVGQTPKCDKTLDGKSRIRFDIGCGVNDPDNLKYATWRHCIAYGKVADKLQVLHTGSLVLVRGWVTTEALRDNFGKPIIENDNVVKREYLICFNAELPSYEPLQSQLPLAVASRVD